MSCPDCERLIVADQDARMQRFALDDIENLAKLKGQWAIARMARIAKLGKEAYIAELRSLDKKSESATIPS